MIVGGVQYLWSRAHMGRLWHARKLHGNQDVRKALCKFVPQRKSSTSGWLEHLEVAPAQGLCPKCKYRLEVLIAKDATKGALAEANRRAQALADERRREAEAKASGMREVAFKIALGRPPGMREAYPVRATVEFAQRDGRAPDGGHGDYRDMEAAINGILNSVRSWLVDYYR